MENVQSAGQGEEAGRVVSAQQVVVERDGIYWPGVHEERCNVQGVNHGVPHGPVEPGVYSGELFHEQPLTEQAALSKQVIDKIPGEIHQLMDGCVHCWSCHASMVLPGTDRVADDPGCVLSMLRVTTFPPRYCCGNRIGQKVF